MYIVVGVFDLNVEIGDDCELEREKVICIDFLSCVVVVLMGFILVGVSIRKYFCK